MLTTTQRRSYEARILRVRDALDAHPDLFWNGQTSLDADDVAAWIGQSDTTTAQAEAWIADLEAAAGIRAPAKTPTPTPYAPAVAAPKKAAPGKVAAKVAEIQTTIAAMPATSKLALGLTLAGILAVTIYAFRNGGKSHAAN